MPDASAPPDVVQRLSSDDVPERGSVKFEFTGPGGQTVEAFCVRYRGVLQAWVNSCPHWGVGLDLDDGVFWQDGDGPYLVCQNHAARFRPDDGYCESGPCFGGFLKPVPVEEADGVVTLFRPAWPDPADWL